MNLREFEDLSQSEQAEAWQKLSQEERDSILSEKRAGRDVHQSLPRSSSEPPKTASPAANHEDRITNSGGITKFQGNVIIFLLLVALGVPFFGMLRPTQQWEYRIESPNDVLFSPMMNQYGREGWELVSARRASDGSGTMSYECIFKREKR